MAERKGEFHGKAGYLLVYIDDVSSQTAADRQVFQFVFTVVGV